MQSSLMMFVSLIWIETMRALRQALREQAVPVDDSGQLCTFLISLNSKWDTTVDNIWAWQEMPPLSNNQPQFSWVRVLNLLRSKEAKDGVKEEKGKEQALPATRGGGKPRGSGAGGRSGRRKGAACTWCQKPGHPESDCWSKEDG